MIKVTLPDGKVLEVARGTTVGEVAHKIGPRLGKAALGGKLNGELVDLMRPIEHDAALEILTDKNADALYLLRHSAAHMLATAVRKVRPKAGIGFGPPIDDGFYYDFDVSEPFTPEDVERIEEEMHRVSGDEQRFERQQVSKAEARQLFSDDPLKLERLEELGDDEVITVYRNGPFLDLCRGPHVPDTGRIKHFKLMSVAGAYWRGDEKRQMLQRIYGTAWFTREELELYLHRLEEAKRRDHRKLGRELDLFIFHPFSPGAAFWSARGEAVFHELAEWMRTTLLRNGYDVVKTPLLYNKGLWEISGHWGKYRENMFLVLDTETNEHDFSLKPMNCPSHHLMFGLKRRSYRELPIRYGTQDVLHRNEVSGALSGLTRVRQFQQDDAHIYLMEEQVTAEVKRLVEMINYFYHTLGLTYVVKFGTRPEQRLGSDELWDRAEGKLRAALEEVGLPYTENPGDAAFYGPKIDFHVQDAIGRTWQLGTIQLDYNAPERFDLWYVGEDNQDHRPVCIHRAIFGSFERFIAILIEHFAGAFPLWLAPEQVRVLPITDEVKDVAARYVEQLRDAGVRAHLDERTETLNYKIREAETQKVPYMAVVGKREAENGSVAVRRQGAGQKQEVMPLDDFVSRLQEQIETKALN
ncbi:MAG TPA: threonine--tRNA ligase [Longimicrobiales bacterium]|nr:threonine--tRNA ligase [Longimicrobiales bacterium]